MTTDEFQSRPVPPQPIPEELIQALRAEEVEPIEEEKKSASDVEDLSDLFQAPLPTDSDIEIEDVVNVTEEDVYGDGGADMSDLLDVDDEDVLEVGPEQEEEPRPVPRYRIKPKSIKRRENGNSSMGGMQY